MRAAIYFTLLLLLSFSAGALPFSKSSGVVELTPQTLTNFLNTHKPVFIMFYAPWCGHCKSLHPDWEKFAKSVKDVVRVGAINADQYREIGGQFGIQGFPTIKYWKMGSKKGMKPMDFQGQRSHAALHSAALREITHSVVTIASQEDISKQMEKASSGKAVVLFTSKNKSPPIFSVLSQSPHFKGNIAFLLASEKTKELNAALGVDKFPSLIVLSKNGDKEGFETELYTGEMAYMSIAKFLQSSLGIETKADESATTAEEKPKPKPVKHSHPAHPVAPVELTADSFNTFCAPTAPKIHGQQPFCVVALGEKLSLKEVHGKYQNEGVLFFYANDDAASQYVDKLSAKFNSKIQFEINDIVVLRAGKDRTKFLVWKESEGDFDDFLQRVLGGTISFQKQQGFPKL